MKGVYIMDWKKEFESPKREYGVYPIIHSNVTNLERVETIERKGFAGVVGNINYTPDYPDNNDEWEKVEKGLRAYMDKGMRTWIYDEKGYPSGTAGGAVLDRHPEYEAIALICLPYWRTLSGAEGECRIDAPNGKLFKVMLVSEDGAKEAVDVTDTANERGTLRFVIPEGSWKLWFFVERPMYDSSHVVHSHAEPRRYIDLFDADATREFINVTYEKYAERMSDEFNKGIKAFFTDEPSLMGWNIPEASYPLLSWSKYFAERFEKRYGYGVEKALVAVCSGTGPEFMRRRCDFWELTADMVSQNFIKVIGDWCIEHGTQLSGHLIEEENIIAHIYSYGSYYRAIREMGYPGIDQLSSDPMILMDHTTLPIARLAASAADVFERGESFTEASGHTEIMHRNMLVPVSWMKASSNWHFALGINNINSYYNVAMYSDEEMQSWNKYTARLGAAMRKGTRKSRVAILYPENAAWGAFTPTEHARNAGQSKLMLDVNESFINSSWAMLDRQIDFDYINEQELNSGIIENGVISVRSRRYECLILPCAYLMEETSFKRICQFIEQGGLVVVNGLMPKYSRDTGKVSEYYNKLIAYQADGRLISTEGTDFSAAAEKLPHTIRVTGDATVMNAVNLEQTPTEKLSRMLLSHVRENGDETIILLANMGGRNYVGTLELPECKRLYRLDPDTGDVTELSASREMEICIPAYMGTIFVLEK